MPKFSDKDFLNFTSDDVDVDDVAEDYRNAVKDEGCRIGDRFFFYQRGMFHTDVLSLEHLLWMYPARTAQKGKSGEQFHNDRGQLVCYTKEGKRIDLTFKTPHMAETLFSLLVPALQEYHVVAGMSPELLRGMEEGGVEGFQRAMDLLRQRYQEQNRAGDPHRREY